MPDNQPATNEARRQRELLTQIARLRRRIDRRIDKLVDRSFTPRSVHEYVRRRPGRSLLAAAGVGFALSRLFNSQREERGRGNPLDDLAAEAAWRQLWKAILQLVAGRLRTRNSPSGSESSDE